MNKYEYLLALIKVLQEAFDDSINEPLEEIYWEALMDFIYIAANTIFEQPDMQKHFDIEELRELCEKRLNDA